MKKTIFTFFILIVCHSLLMCQEQQVVFLWSNGAPGFENLKNIPEQAQDYWVKNIHNPSLTVYLPPKEKANGASVIICPGGGHNKLVITSEGKDAAEYFNSIGITAFVLKYRLFREEVSPYKQEHILEDGRRAMRMVKHNASQWNLDTSRVGLLGFSAGGELAGWVSFNTSKEDFKKTDNIDKLSDKPGFLILVYPGPLAVPNEVSSTAPPLFLVAANDDECCSEPVIKLLQLYRKAGAKSELHLYAAGNHAFNMGKRSSLQSIHDWPQRLTDWLLDAGFIKKQ